MDIKEFAKSHNDSINGLHFFLVITTGEERKRFSVWEHDVATWNGKVFPDKYRKVHLFFSNPENLIKDVKGYLKRNSRCEYEVVVKVDTLTPFKKENVPSERKIPFGKYIYMDIDEIEVSDKPYFDWLVDSVDKRVHRDYEYKYPEFDYYIMQKKA